MRKLFLIVTAVLLSQVFVSAQNQKPKLSAFTQQFLVQYNKQKDKSAHIPSYNYKNIDNRLYLSSLIKVDPSIDESKLENMGVYIGTKAGSIWTAQIPVDSIYPFIALTGISYIQLDMPIIPLLDSARKQTHADSAQKGINLPFPVTGKNVIVGIIDAGFDFNHPTMYDTTDNRYRIKRVWAQKISGTHPSGFAYGREITDTNAIRYRGTDTSLISHGTHVTGIAAGSGYGSNPTNSRFRGMALESDIVLVGIMPAPGEWVTAGESDIIDGMNYIYHYASTVGRPAVVNLSWGSTLGPHDGNSLFSQACDALTGEGKIFVCAAGNNGEDTVHLQKSFTTTDTTVSTFVTFSPYLDSTNQTTWVDAWGDTGKTFCVNIKLYDTTTVIDSTGYICLDDTTHNFKLLGSNGDTCYVSITSTVIEYNGKPHAFISLYSKVHDNICLTTKANSGTVNMWEGYVLPPEGYYGYFKKLGYPFAVSGDAKYTVSDIGCTRSALTVGAYTSKVSFTNINGAGLYYPGAVHGQIAPFSSFGPTEDMRVKPDITAPGFALASSVNSYDPTYNQGGSNYSSVIKADTLGPRVYRYAMMAGTSMASPCAAGIVAMMLQMNPFLTPDETKTIINNTAIKDSYTGVLPSSGTTTWGHGKIYAYGAISYMVGSLVVKSEHVDQMDCILYPNPNQGGFTIDYNSNSEGQLTIEMYDVTGKQVMKQFWFVADGTNSRVFETNGLPKGIYYTKISNSNGFTTIKTILE